MTKAEFERWTRTVPDQGAALAKSFFTVIRRDPNTLQLNAVPYSVAYEASLGARPSC